MAEISWIDLVRRIWGPCSPADADELLWGTTCFPFGSALQVARQLREYKKRSGESIERALQLADDDMMAAHAAGKET